MRNSHFLSSGDLLTDRRFLYGQSLLADGDLPAAIDLFQQALERNPDWPVAWHLLAMAMEAAGNISGAIEACRQAVRCDREDRLGSSLALARLDPAVTVNAAPPAYVESLFDSYAPEFDHALVERLEYAVPEKLATLIRATRNARPFLKGLDLGCGTGLMADALEGAVSWLEGVDLSGQMIQQAQSKRLYQQLTQSDLHEFLMAASGQYDLITAADVLIYIGDLERIFAAVRERLAPDGLFAFSLELTDDFDWKIASSLRFTHHPDYVQRALDGAGLTVLVQERCALRKDRGEDIRGLLTVCGPAVITQSAALEPTRELASRPASDNALGTTH